jgi:hypothetical protein
MPMLGGRSKGSSGKVDSETMGRLGKLDSREGILWLPESPAPRPTKVHRLATDGTHTAVRGDELKEGLRIIVDLAAGTRTVP